MSNGASFNQAWRTLGFQQDPAQVDPADAFEAYIKQAQAVAASMLSADPENAHELARRIERLNDALDVVGAVQLRRQWGQYEAPLIVPVEYHNIRPSIRAGPALAAVVATYSQVHQATVELVLVVKRGDGRRLLWCRPGGLRDGHPLLAISGSGEIFQFATLDYQPRGLAHPAWWPSIESWIYGVLAARGAIVPKSQRRGDRRFGPGYEDAIQRLTRGDARPILGIRCDRCGKSAQLTYRAKLCTSCSAPISPASYIPL
jgi:hypothetical protein